MTRSFTRVEVTGHLSYVPARADFAGRGAVGEQQKALDEFVKSIRFEK